MLCRDRHTKSDSKKSNHGLLKEIKIKININSNSSNLAQLGRSLNALTPEFVGYMSPSFDSIRFRIITALKGVGYRMCAEDILEVHIPVFC
jgi:hypothetical protein